MWQNIENNLWIIGVALLVVAVPACTLAWLMQRDLKAAEHVREPPLTEDKVDRIIRQIPLPEAEAILAGWKNGYARFGGILEGQYSGDIARIDVGLNGTFTVHCVWIGFHATDKAKDPWTEVPRTQPFTARLHDCFFYQTDGRRIVIQNSALNTTWYLYRWNHEFNRFDLRLTRDKLSTSRAA